jgi:hypothetical protein
MRSYVNQLIDLGRRSRRSTMRREHLALRIIALAIGAMPWLEALSNPTGPTPVRGVASISGLGTSAVRVDTNNAVKYF